MSLTLTPNSLSTLSSVSIPITLTPTLTTYSPTQTTNNLLPVYSPTFSNLTLTPTQTVTSLENKLAILAVKPTLYVDIDTGLNDSYIVQKDVTKYFMYKALDKWLYTDYKSALKYLTYKNGKVDLAKKINEKESVDVSKENTKELEAKSDYIGENILTETKTRALLLRIMKELGFKWFELPYREELVKDVIGKYIKKKLKKMVLGDRSDDTNLVGGSCLNDNEYATEEELVLKNL